MTEEKAKPTPRTSKKNYETILRDIEANLGSLQNARVLDVGTNMHTGGLVEALSPSVREIIGINIIGTARQIAENASVMRDDIRKTGFPDRRFDVVISYAAFEHVHDIDVALAEIFRILRPGGRLYSSFGPIWSCKWGHHLWLTTKAATYTYQDFVLPPYCHLHMSIAELAIYIETMFPDCEEAADVAEYALNSSHQNQVLHSGYEKALAHSDFEVRTFRGSTNKKLDALYGEPPPNVMAALKRRYGAKENFSASNLTIIAKRPK